MSSIARIPEGYLRLRIELQYADDGHPLVKEEVDCRDVFDVIYELERVTGPRFRKTLTNAALVHLRRRKSPDPPLDAGQTASQS